MSFDCRFCSSRVTQSFVNLGKSPLSNAFVGRSDLNKLEAFFPLHVWVCKKCWLTQLEVFESPAEIFSDYVYFSSFSKSWLKHAEVYVKDVVERFSLSKESLVLEVASNDGYLLQYFKERSIPVLGVEPASNVASVAIERGIDTRIEFFGVESANKIRKKANLIVANNVLAHVPDINDFVAGLKLALADDGVISFEFPHLLRLVDQVQYDTIYHEHFSYLSLLTVQAVLFKHNLKVFDVEELNSHGGSLRVYATHLDGKVDEQKSVQRTLSCERGFGLDSVQAYSGFSEKVEKNKRQLLSVLIDIKNDAKRIVGYGAAAKGNTLLNYCGIKSDMIDFVVDKNEYKQGKYLPGSNIPVKNVDSLIDAKPDYILILPWNLKSEIMEQLKVARSWGGKFIIPIPSPEIV